MHEHLWLGDLFAVVWMIFPFVAVVVAAPCVSIVLGKVRCHVPERCLVVVKVIVQVEQPGVDGPVGFKNGYIRKLNVGRDLVFPHGFNHPVFDQNMPFVDDVGLTRHGHNSALQHVGAFVDVVVEAVASYHVLRNRIGRIIAPSGCWR